MLEAVYKKLANAFLPGGRPDHPLANLKQARKLISELVPDNDVGALDDVTAWLRSISRSKEFKPDDRFELVDLLDQAGKPRQRKVAQLLGADCQDPLREKKLRILVFTFWKTLAQAYIRCLDQAQSGAAGKRVVRIAAPVVVARALRALASQLKWAYQQYGPVDPAIWIDLGRLYKFAEDEGSATAPISIYSGTSGDGTIQQEFLRALVLAVSSTDGLTPIEQETAERTIAHLCPLFVLHSGPEPRGHHFFDLAVPRQPARRHAGMQPGRTTRFIDASAALPALEKLIANIAVTKTVPSDISLGRPFEADAVLPVMRHLARYWSERPPARRSQRRKIAAAVTVAHSYKEVLTKILPTAVETSAQEAASENWTVQDLNETGFGASIPHGQGKWIRVGTLLGMQMAGTPSWSVGVVRRLTRDDEQQCRVGIQLLAKAAIPVTLSPMGEVSPSNAIRRGDPAVLLSTALDQNGEIGLLLRGASFTSGQGLEMMLQQQRYRLAPSRLTEEGDDFDCAQFKVWRLVDCIETTDIPPRATYGQAPAA